MQKIEHTKGPWEYRPDEDGKPIVSNGVPIAYMEVYELEGDDGAWEKENEANARLIAAAPKMEDVLRLALTALNTSPRFRVGETTSYAIASEIERTLREAIGE
jgi:hypothetical protein